MINQTIQKIMNSCIVDLAGGAKSLLNAGIQNVFTYLQKSDITKTVFPEQVIRLLSTIHYMIQKKMIDVQLFQECNVFWITNVLNSSFNMERLSTEMSSSSTFAKSSHSQNSQKHELQNQYFKTESKQEKVYSKRMDCLSSYSDKQQCTERHTIREPLTYQSMLQMYYTYLKKICHQQSCGIPIIELYVIQNICSMGLRIIEGQKCPKLNYCFELILKDLEQFQREQIDQLKLLMKQMDDSNQQNIFEIYKMLCLNGKQIKFFGMLNKMTINQKELKQFKKESKEFVIACKQNQRKIKIQQNQDRLSVTEFKTDNFFDYERRKVYEHY